MKDLLAREPLKTEDGIDQFVDLETIGDFKETESKFWDQEYEQRDIAHQSTDHRSLPFHDQFRAPIRELPDGAVVLELACGVRGDLLDVALEKDIRLIESDISPIAVAKAQELTDKLDVPKERLTYAVIDAEDLPFRDGALDATFVAASYHHVPDPVKTMKEMARVTKAGGPVVIGVEPNRWPYYTVYAALKPVQWVIRRKRGRALNSIADDTTRGFSYGFWVRTAREAGLEIERIIPVKFLLQWYENYFFLRERLVGGGKEARPEMIEKLVRWDEKLGRVPGLRRFPWHWTVIMRKKG